MFGAGIDSPNAEWNVYVDPTAAAEVLASGAPIVLVSLDATSQVPVTTSFLDLMDVNAHEKSAALVDRLVNGNPSAATGQSYFWDPLAAAAIVEPQLLSTETAKIRVVTAEGADTGRTMRTDDGSPVTIATGADASAFYTLLVRTLDGLDAGEPLASPEPPVGEGVVRYDGTTCTYEGPSAVPPGRMTFTFETTVQGWVGAVVHLVGGATVTEVLAWVAAHPGSQEMPPGVDELVVLEPGGTTRVKARSGTVAVACGADTGVAPLVAGTFTVD